MARRGVIWLSEQLSLPLGTYGPERRDALLLWEAWLVVLSYYTSTPETGEPPACNTGAGLN